MKKNKHYLIILLEGQILKKLMEIKIVNNRKNMYLKDFREYKIISNSYFLRKLEMITLDKYL
jgi:hypothetical protein